MKEFVPDVIQDELDGLDADKVKDLAPDVVQDELDNLDDGKV